MSLSCYGLHRAAFRAVVNCFLVQPFAISLMSCSSVFPFIASLYLTASILFSNVFLSCSHGGCASMIIPRFLCVLVVVVPCA